MISTDLSGEDEQAEITARARSGKDGFPAEVHNISRVG